MNTERRQYGEPVGAGFVALSPSDRATWLYDIIRQPEFVSVVEKHTDWTPFKNERYESAFLRAFVALSQEAPDVGV